MSDREAKWAQWRYQGRPITQLTREELLDALVVCAELNKLRTEALLGDLRDWQHRVRPE